jgi:hypothetical protein
METKLTIHRFMRAGPTSKSCMALLALETQELQFNEGKCRKNKERKMKKRSFQID